MPLYGPNYGLPIDGPITINRDSLQAFGLCQWYPGAHPHGTGSGVVREYVSGFKTANLNGSGRSYPDASHVSGPFGSAFPFAAPFFDGSGVYMTGLTYSGGSATGGQNGPQPFPVAPPFSVSIWIRPWGTANGVVWWMGRDNGGSWYAHYLWADKDSGLASINTVNNNVFRSVSSANGSVPTSKWTHICGVWHSTTDRRIYVNGIFHGQNTQSSDPDLSTGAFIVAGADKSGVSYGNFWQGHIFDLRMYRRAISAPEVMAIYDPQTRFDLFRTPRYSRPFPKPSASSASGTAAVTVGAATCSGSATHTPPTFSATGSCSVRAATCSGSATHTPPTFSATGSCSVRAATCSGSATHTAPTYTGNGSCTVGAATCSGSATHTAPTYTGNGSCTVGAATCSGSATFSTGHSATSAVITGAATCSGSATHTPPTFSATGFPSIAPITCSGSATHTAPTYTGTGTGTIGAVTCTGSASFITSGSYTATATVTIGRATASGSGSFVTPLVADTMAPADPLWVMGFEL